MSDYSNINNYILKEDIGEGNFGKVKLGIFKQTGEEFAIKILNKKKIKIKMKNTVFKENEIITKFNHVNVIFVFDIIEDPDNYYIVMEYCKSGELFDYIVDRQHLEEEEASIFFYQLINGVDYIHSLGVAHRDLKPENLLLTENKILKIIDFGLSHEFNGEDFLKTKCGSPSYAAPEIIKGLPYDGFKTDIWCCGIILYAMVCGYLPFEGDNNKILFKNIVECKPEIPDYLNEETQDLISSILKSEPDDRITIEEIKKHAFYLKGKELCNIDYPKLQKMINKKRHNMSNNNYLNNFDKQTDDIEFINQQIKISIDNDENDQYDEILKIDKNKKDNIEKKDKKSNNDEDNEILIKSLKSINEISGSKITNNSKYDNKREKSSKKIKEEEKNNEEPRRHFKFLINKKPNLKTFRDKIFVMNKDFNQKLENYNNNMNLILNTDANAIVNKKINNNLNLIYNNNNNNQLLKLNNNNLNINPNGIDNNTNNVNTISSTINGNQKNISNYTNIINPSINNNNYTNNNEKKSLLIENIISNSRPNMNKNLKINKNKTPRKFKDFSIGKNMPKSINKKKTDNKYNNLQLNDINRRIIKKDIKSNMNNNNIVKNNINIINNINNTINNYGTLNILSSINYNKIYNNKANKKSKISPDKKEKLKTEGNAFNAIKEMIYNNKKRIKSSYKIPPVKPNQNNNYLINVTKDYHSVKSSNSRSTKNSKSNNGSNPKSYNNRKPKNSILFGNNPKKGFIIKTNKLKNINQNNIITKNNYNNYLRYPLLNIGNKLFSDKNSANSGVSSNVIFVNNKNNISNPKNNSKRNKVFYNRNNLIINNNSGNKSENCSVNKKNEIKKNINEKIKNKKDCINYFNALSTMFMKTENNFHKNKFKNSNTNSVNSRMSKNSKNSKNSKATSKNSKSTKSSKSSKKKYNLIRNALKNKMGNFIFNKKGGSEGKTNRFIQHSKLLNINSLRNNNNIHNINNILDNCIRINNNNVINIKNNNKLNEVNNIKVIKREKPGKKYIYNQINFEAIKNMYNLK